MDNSGDSDLALLDDDQAEDQDHEGTNGGEETNKDALDNCVVDESASVVLHRLF